MTTDRTQPARPAALNDRSSAAPAEKRDGGAFAALLDAHAPAPRREEPQARRDAVRDRGPEPRDAGVHREPPRDAARRDAGHHEQPAAERPAAPVAAAPAVAAPAPAIVPPADTAAPAPAPAAPALPATQIFMLAPEAVVAAPVPTLPVAAPALPAEAPAPTAVAPQPGAPVAATPAIPAQPAAAVPVAQASVAETAQENAAAPAPAAGHPDVPQAAASKAELPAAPAEPAAPVAEAPAAPEPHVAAPARTVATPAEPAPAAAPSAQAPAADPVAPAPAAAPPSGPAAPERTVPLYRAPAAVGTLLHVAVDRGITRAKMALRPAELGGIEIRLQTTAGGIAAQVVADSPEAARLLAQAGDDLRRALEARDVTLVSLEVSTSSDDRQQQRARGEWTDGDDAGLTSPGRTAGAAEGDAEPVPTTQTVIELPGGLLVDVLA